VRQFSQINTAFEFWSVDMTGRRRELPFVCLFVCFHSSRFKAACILEVESNVLVLFCWRVKIFDSINVKNPCKIYILHVFSDIFYNYMDNISEQTPLEKPPDTWHFASLWLTLKAYFWVLHVWSNMQMRRYQKVIFLEIYLGEIDRCI